jgi:hypothetical protein
MPAQFSENRQPSYHHFNMRHPCNVYYVMKVQSSFAENLALYEASLTCCYTIVCVRHIGCHLMSNHRDRAFERRVKEKPNVMHIMYSAFTATSRNVSRLAASVEQRMPSAQHSRPSCASYHTLFEPPRSVDACCSPPPSCYKLNWYPPPFDSEFLALERVEPSHDTT